MCGRYHHQATVRRSLTVDEMMMANDDNENIAEDEHQSIQMCLLQAPFVKVSLAPIASKKSTVLFNINLHQRLFPYHAHALNLYTHVKASLIWFLDCHFPFVDN